MISGSHGHKYEGDCHLGIWNNRRIVNDELGRLWEKPTVVSFVLQYR
jgi:hypothetical protein